MARAFIGNFKGPKGDKGETGPKGPQGNTGATGQRGSRWTEGTAITGTSTTATVFSGTGIADALVNDMYLNTSTSNVYRCTVGGAASVAKWVFVGCIKGEKGDKGDRGATGATGPQGPQGPSGTADTTFTEASALTKLTSGESFKTMLGKLAKAVSTIFDKFDKNKVVNNQTTTEAGYALDARQANPNLDGTLAKQVADLNGSLKNENIIPINIDGVPYNNLNFYVIRGGYCYLSLFLGSINNTDTIFIYGVPDPILSLNFPVIHFHYGAGDNKIALGNVFKSGEDGMNKPHVRITPKEVNGLCASVVYPIAFN